MLMEATGASGIRRVLVPLDGSFFAEQALPFAQAIAGPETELILLEVAPPAEPVRRFFGAVLITTEEIRQSYKEDIETALETARRAWLGERRRVRIETAVGDAAEEILRVAEGESVDLIVMASHGRGAVGRWVIGSVADRVARTALIPVMVVRPRGETPTEPGTCEILRLIVPLDGSELAEQALPFVERLAASLHVPVLLVMVTDVVHDLARAAARAMPHRQEVYDDLLDNARRNANDHLDGTASRLQRSGLEVSAQVLDGEAADAIANRADPTDVIVMTSHGRGGLRCWLIGSVAEKLVREGPVPVILVPSTVRRQVLEPRRDAAVAGDLAGAAVVAS
jgi:nucleotide-binding universal stress UspA family protein